MERQIYRWTDRGLDDQTNIRQTDRQTDGCTQGFPLYSTGHRPKNSVLKRKTDWEAAKRRKRKKHYNRRCLWYPKIDADRSIISSDWQDNSMGDRIVGCTIEPLSLQWSCLWTTFQNLGFWLINQGAADAIIWPLDMLDFVNHNNATLFFMQ